jgi:hypothetical protein
MQLPGAPGVPAAENEWRQAETAAVAWTKGTLSPLLPLGTEPSAGQSFAGRANEAIQKCSASPFMSQHMIIQEATAARALSLSFVGPIWGHSDWFLPDTPADW